MYRRGNEDTSIKGRSGGRGAESKGRTDVKKVSLQCWKKMQITETTADQSIADNPHQCSFFDSSAFGLTSSGSQHLRLQSRDQILQLAENMHQEVKKAADPLFSVP